MWLLRAYMESMPAIQAREALQAYKVASVAAGTIKQPDRVAAIQQWKREANRGVKTAKPGIEQAAAMLGIQIVKEKGPDD